MIIRPVSGNDAQQFLELNKKLDESGFMLYEPGERKTTVEEQRKSLERIQFEKKSIFFVAEVDNKIVGFIAAIGGKVKRNQHSAYLVLGVLEEYQGLSIISSKYKSLLSMSPR
ncbi:GNAT family N-acetyltransferase [Bacillus sp. WMMC1349]|uniref:GNAT family N-acetyltransferase n=1 Tax=Bacillus sp. WMMC1349 TaxID=2736254 RepID=UPI00155823D4|nr:GNAT family N-acetyltransferase [Bacillus sp. WMMC1349]NPC91519.1 GNAT family N-acetyltransferase [Bacillus sp. WMMC1349]